MKEIIEKGVFSKSKPKKAGKIIRKDVLKDYVRHVHGFVNTKKLSNLKLACDAGNGMAGKVVPMVYRGLNAKIVPLYFKLDGNFPNHPADPSKYKNLVQLWQSSNLGEHYGK